MILLDTNVLIEVLKGNMETRQRIEGFSAPSAISSISAMELMYGARDKAELLQLDKFITLFQMMHLSRGISTGAMQLIRSYAKSHTLDIPDALIAATALEHGASLFTYNLTRHSRNQKGNPQFPTPTFIL